MDVGARDGGVEPHVPELQAVEGVAAPQRNGSGNGRPRIETKVLLGYLSATSIKGRNRRERARASLFSRCSARDNAATRPYVYLHEEGIGLTPSEP